MESQLVIQGGIQGLVMTLIGETETASVTNFAEDMVIAVLTHPSTILQSSAEASLPSPVWTCGSLAVST